MNRSALTQSDTLRKPVALSEFDSRRQSTPVIPRPSTDQFLEVFNQSLQDHGQSPLVFNLYGVGGVGKSTTLRTLAQGLANDKGNLARVSFGETEQVETPIELMVTLFQTLVSQNNWIFKPKFLVMHERYEKTLQELVERPMDEHLALDEWQQQAYQTLASYGTPVSLEAPAEQSTAAAAAQTLRDEQAQTLLHRHPSTQHDQALQTLILEPQRVLTQAFAEALQKRAKRQPVVLILDTYEKASLAVDTWLWHSLLSQEILQGSGVRIVLANHSRLGRHWQRWVQQGVVVEQELDPLSLEETHHYLQQVDNNHRNGGGKRSLDDPAMAQYFTATEGLPYALHHAHAGQGLSVQLGGAASSSPGSSPGTQPGKASPSPLPQNSIHPNNTHPNSTSSNSSSPNNTPQNIAGVMTQNLSLIQRYLVGLAACCRSFTQDLIEYLLLAQDANFALAVEAECNGFEWLVQQPYMEQVQGCWRLDDVARNVFRQNLLETDEKLFFKVQEQLADYFLARSDEAVPPEASPRAKYQHPIWQRGRAEYLYYLLLSRHPEAHQAFRTVLLEGHYFQQDAIVQEVFKALLSEFPLAEHALLDNETCQFLQRIEPAVRLGSLVLDRARIPYGLLSEAANLDEDEVDAAVQACLQPMDELEGLARFVALFNESKQCLAGEQLSHLQQAQAVAETVVTEHDPEFSAELFLWKLGDRFSSLGEYESAVAAYDRALAFTPTNAEAWDNRGSSLGCLGQLEAAIISFDKALELQPDSHDLWHSRGLALAKSERYKEAIGSFDQALELKPEKHEPWYDKACCYALQEMPTLALESLEKAIALNGDYREMAQQDGDLAVLSGDEVFQQMVAAAA